MANAGKLGNSVFGGWSVNGLAVIQGGQPIYLSCPSGPTSGTNCNDLKVPGQSQDLGLKTKTDPTTGKINLFWFGNPAAFNQPCQLGDNGQLVTPLTPTGCVPLNGLAILGDRPGAAPGPGIRRFDFSAFKGFQISDRISMQFRAEFFNILNHPNFNAPNFGGNGVSAIGGSGDFTNSAFGQIGSTRFAPYDPRQIQFALKLYY